ncbi:MAG: translocation/assembly module TamB domain-containing protein [Crocinitomicaceae bacterium]
MKIAKGIGHIVLLFVEIILVTIILFAFFIRSSTFQTFLGKKATTYLSKELGTKVDIDKIDIVFFDRLNLEGVFIEDKNLDTLLAAQEISINLGDWDLKQKYAIIDNVTLVNAKAILNKTKGDNTFNFQHIIDYLGPSSEDTASLDFDITVNEIALNNINFQYNDYNSEKTDFGIDYSHIDVQRLHGRFSNFNFSKNTIESRIDQLSFIEQSGLELKNLSSKVLYNENIISLNELQLSLKNSELNADVLELKTNNGPKDFEDFLNQVNFNAHIENTKIALADLAYFVPQLNGMSDTLTIVNAELYGPVNGMEISNLDIQTLTKTKLQGNFQIPNLDDINTYEFDEEIAFFQTSVDDIETLNLQPFLNGKKHIELPPNLRNLATIKVINGRFKGDLKNFMVQGKVLTGLGNLYSQNGIKFQQKSDGLFYYHGIQSDTLSKHLVIEDLNLAKLSGTNSLGKVNGYVQILPGSKGFSTSEMDLMFRGYFNNLSLNGYNYRNISVDKGNYSNSRFTGKVDVKDENLALKYDGYIDFKKELQFDFNLKVDSAFIVKLNFMEGNVSTNVKTNMNINLKGNSIDNMAGSVNIENFQFFDGQKELDFTAVDLLVLRTGEEDVVTVMSNYVDASLKGKFDFTQIVPMLNNQVAQLVPNYLQKMTIPAETVEDFKLIMNLKNINPILRFFDTTYYVEANTLVELESHLENQTTTLDIKSKKFEYQDKIFKGIHLKHDFDSLYGILDYDIRSVQLSDSMRIDSFKFNSLVKSNSLSTDLGWQKNAFVNSAQFKIITELRSNNDIFTRFEPSYFYLQDSRWDIAENSSFLWNPDHINVDNIVINSNNHYVKLDGQVSKNPDEWLNIDIKDFDLSELNGFLGGSLTLDGVLNMKGGVADLYNNIRATSDASIKNLKINSELVGDIAVEGRWDKINNALDLNGNLFRDNVKRFDFNGFYYVERETDNLDLNLVFEHTDIAFLNAFSDPELYTNIRGNLDGELKVRGELDNPIIIGDLMVEPTTVKVPMFNVDYKVAGLINFNEGEILAFNLDITDQLGNMGIGMMQIYHTNYSQWNYDVTLDLEDPNTTKTFLAMDTYYKDGDVYYGKAFVTGTVNIFGFNDITEIGVDLKTEKGTDLTLPLYGSSEIEESSFVKFYDPDTLSRDTADVKIERLGMTLTMNFRVTDEAKVNIVFDPLLNDQIIARGSGDIELSMDNYGDMAMFGKYTIHNGVYNFNMKNVVKEDFEIIDGSTVVWTQSPYDANIDIKTRFKRNVDMGDIIASDVAGTSGKDIVYGYLNLSQTLLSPKLEFDITAPQAKDEAKAALNQIRAIEDDLNKQFFSLLIFKKFIAVEGSTASGNASGNVAEDIVNQQINAVLGQIGENYNLNSDIGTDHAQLGFSTSFLDDRLKITTSVGVVSAGEAEVEGESKASNIVGDVNIQYELNKEGTFTISVFNESNEIANQDRGPFTQGFGLSYQESFNSKRDFKLLQGFLNIFRKQEKQKGPTNNRKTPVQDDFKPVAPIEE